MMSKIYAIHVFNTVFYILLFFAVQSTKLKMMKKKMKTELRFEYRLLFRQIESILFSFFLRSCCFKIRNECIFTRLVYVTDVNIMSQEDDLMSDFIICRRK